MILRDGALAALDLFLPVTCVSCERVMDAGEKGIVCGRCWSRLSLLPDPKCARCGHPLARYDCQWCALLPAFVRAARSVAWVSGGTASEIIHALKYDGWSRTAEAMGERMARTSWPRDVVLERAALVAVPLSRSRRRERGYNQSELLADSLSKSWGIPVLTGALCRVRDTESQTRLTPDDRLRNVAGAFAVDGDLRRSMVGQHLILVDDVVTTAATMNACARALHQAGARTISYVTFGRARASGDPL